VDVAFVEERKREREREGGKKGNVRNERRIGLREIPIL